MTHTLSFIKIYTNELVQYDSLKLQELFLEYFNNYLSVDCFAEHNLLTRYEASRVIDCGRAAHEYIVSKNKEGI